MIAFKYSKINGGEFISHLDTLRHLNKTFIRAGLKVKMSQGFHPHMLVYMSSPIGVGLKSCAEYCCVDVDISPEEFMERFNASSPKVLRCLEAWSVVKNPNFASVIVKAKYFLEGLDGLDESAVLALDSFTVKDKNGKDKEVRDKIYSLERTDGGYVAVLAAGNNALRPDSFVKRLNELYGVECLSIEKLESFPESGSMGDLLALNG